VLFRSALKLGLMGTVGLDWNKVWNKILRDPEYKSITEEDLDLDYRYETWGQLYDRACEETSWEIFKKSHYSAADTEIKKQIEEMLKYAKLEAYNRFILNADPHVWECLMCNPLGLYLIDTEYKLTKKEKKKKKGSNRNRNVSMDIEGDSREEIYGTEHPTLNDFFFRVMTNGK